MNQSIPSRSDEAWMARAAALARKGEGNTSPNPMVGALVVRDDNVLGSGYHKKAGEAHAERIALKQAGSAAEGATLYVTLEPCCHSGKTPPCTDVIIDSGIARLVAGVHDPNPLVHGRGFKTLQKAGIQVHHGILKKTCADLVEFHRINMVLNRPMVHLKLALSLDGCIAPARGAARWLTGIPARRYGHRLRRRYDGVMVGIGTVLSDDPQLDVRLYPSPDIQPAPIVLDSEARTPSSARLLIPNENVPNPIFIVSTASRESVVRLRSRGAIVLRCESDSNGGISPEHALSLLYDQGIRSILLEGGARMAASFLHAGLVDRVSLIMAPLFLGEHAIHALHGIGTPTLAEAPRARWRRVRRLGPDLLVDLECGE